MTDKPRALATHCTLSTLFTDLNSSDTLPQLERHCLFSAFHLCVTPLTPHLQSGGVMISSCMPGVPPLTSLLHLLVHQTTPRCQTRLIRCIELRLPFLLCHTDTDNSTKLKTSCLLGYIRINVLYSNCSINFASAKRDQQSLYLVI